MSFFKLADTHGLGLDIIVQTYHERGWMPDWLGYYREAVACGWNPHRILSKLEPVVTDVYGVEWKEEWTKRWLVHTAKVTVP